MIVNNPNCPRWCIIITEKPQKTRYMKRHKPKYIIMWQKWEDPLTQIKNQMGRQIRSQNLNPTNEDWKGDNEENHFDTPMHAIPIMSTPMGFLPTPIPDMSSFNFFIGHTNFNITFNIWQILNNSPGVESLDIFSPYRFRMAIGKAFNESQVKISIATNIKRYLKTHEQKTHDFPA